MDRRVDQSIIMTPNTLFNQPRTPLPQLVPACAADAPGIATLLAQPLPGSVQLALVPTIASCSPRNTPLVRHHAVVAHDASGRVIAHGSRTVRQLWLGGKPRWIGYLGGLRREAVLAGAGRRLASGLAQLSATRATNEVDHDLTSILSDNHSARRLLEADLPGAPSYHYLGDYRTFICLSKKIIKHKLPPGWTISSLRTDDVVTVQRLVDKHALDYAPVVRVADSPNDWLVLYRDEEPLGCVQLLDRRAQQGVTVAGYGPVLRHLRPLVNVGLCLTRRPTLPVPGTSLELAFAAHLSVPLGEATAARALFSAVAREAITRGCHQVVFGLGRHHPLTVMVNTLPAWRIDSRLYAVGSCPLSSSTGPNPEAAWL